MIEVWVRYGLNRWDLVPAGTPFATEIQVGQATFDSWCETWRKFDAVDQEIADMVNAAWEANESEAI